MHFTQLLIYCQDLEAQTRFYHERLGLEVLHQHLGEESHLKMGGTTLVLRQDSHRYQAYHFAINIPAYREKEGLAWLKGLGIEVLPTEDGEIKDFSAWNARSIYFYDPDGNIVELIARRNLKYETETAFGSGSLKEISEIGIGARDLPQLCQWLKEEMGIEIFSGAPVKFCAMGEERALFICVDSREKLWYPTETPAGAAPFSVEIALNGAAQQLTYSEEEGLAAVNG